MQNPITGGGGKESRVRPEVIERDHRSAVPVPANYTVADVGRPVRSFMVLFRRKGTLLLFALTGALLGTLLVWRQPYIYRSHSYLEVMGVNENLLNKRELDPTAATDDSSQVYVNTVARLLQSGPLYNRVADELNKPPLKASSGLVSSPCKPAVTAREIARSIHVTTHDTDRIVEVAADSFDPKRAAAIANALTTTFIQQDLESRWKAASSTSEWLQRELDDLAVKLKSSQDALESFTKQSNLLVAGDEDGVSDSYVRNIQSELARAQADRANKEALYEHAKTAGAGAAVAPDSNLEQYELQLTSLQNQLAELQATFAPDFYKIPPVKAQINQLQKAIDAERQTVMARTENDYRAALRREDLLRSQYNAQLNNATDQTAKLVQYEALKNQVETNQTIYSLMMQKVKAYSVASAMQASNVRIVDPAEPTYVPIRPNKPLTAALTSFGFLCIGSFWLLARAGANRNIMEPGESQQYLKAPELGVIPAATRSARRVNGRIKDPPGLPAFTGRNGTLRLETVAWHSSPSLLAESFRSTSASLLLPTHGKEGHRVLVVTSLSPSEGKTTVASNMAIALAGVAGRVLLIDGDRRRARLHSVFGCSNDKGISDLLQSSDMGVTPSDCIVPTSVPNLSLLPSGHASLDSSDLLYSERMAALMARVRGEFDVVLIDTPPLLHLSDARVFGRMSDGVILVIRTGRVSWDSAMVVEQRLRDDGIPILGTVLNDWDPKKSGYGVYPYDKYTESYFAS